MQIPFINRPKNDPTSSLSNPENPYKNHIPFYYRSRILVSYKWMTITLIFFYTGYALPIFIASNFNVFDNRYHLYKDVLFYSAFLLGYIAVFVVQNVTNSIFTAFPEYQREEKNSDTMNLKEILTSDGYNRIFTLFKWFTSRVIDFFWMILITIIILVITYNNWWNFQGFYYYYNKSLLNSYTNVTGFTVFIFSFILGTTIGSAFGFVITFTFTVFLIPWLKYFSVNSLPWLKHFSIGKKDFMNNKNDEMNLYNIKVSNSNYLHDAKSSQNSKNSTQPLYYNQLYLKIKSLTWVIFKIFFQLLLFLLIATIILIVIQFIDVNKVNYAGLLIIFVIGVFILMAFLANIFSIQRLLIHLKNYSVMKWNDRYNDIINRYISENEKKSEDITQINEDLSIIIQILEREESLPARLIDTRYIIGFLIAIIPPIIPFVLDYLQKVIH